MNSSIPIVLVGLGWVGTHRHAVAIRRSPQFRLLGLVDRNADRARATAQALKISKYAVADHLDAVPWLSEARAITVATPPDSHKDLVISALDRGLHVLTEKPFAMSVAEGEAMLRSAEQNGRTLCISHNFQFSHSARRLQQDLAEGRLGTIRRVHGMQMSNPRRRLPKWYDSLPGGLFYDESPHLLYLVRRFSPGPLALDFARIVPSTMGHRTPSIIQAGYRCAAAAGDIPVTLDMNFEATLSEWQLCVIGDAAMGVVDIFRDIYLRLPNDGLHTTLSVLRTSLTASLQHWGQHFTSGLRHLSGRLDYGTDEIYRLFAEAVSTGNASSDISSHAALEVMRMQHAILAKAACPP